VPNLLALNLRFYKGLWGFVDATEKGGWSAVVSRLTATSAEDTKTVARQRNDCSAALLFLKKMSGSGTQQRLKIGGVRFAQYIQTPPCFLDGQIM
jgi:hypothetical protein